MTIHNIRKLTLATILTAAALAATSGIRTLNAQQPGFTRVPLLDEDMSRMKGPDGRTAQARAGNPAPEVVRAANLTPEAVA